MPRCSLSSKYNGHSLTQPMLKREGIIGSKRRDIPTCLRRQTCLKLPLSRSLDGSSSPTGGHGSLDDSTQRDTCMWEKNVSKQSNILKLFSSGNQATNGLKLN